MVTSRTGTSQWKQVRRHALREAQERGITNCPYCQVRLNYVTGRTPESAEPDHRIPHSRGGTDTLDNLIVICRACNISKSNRAAPKSLSVMARKPLKTSRKW